jgi:NADH dehydrogenase (ubiquinone) Fe-S protein 4
LALSLRGLLCVRTRRWSNPLMGWTSSADTLENVGRSLLFFYTKEEAMRFCDKQGWSYTVDEPNKRKTARQKRYNSYSDNFR